MNNVLDGFAGGAGGWDLAAEWLGLSAEGVENDPASLVTRKKAGLLTVHDDNAIPPLMAMHMIAEATGLPIPEIGVES